MPVRSLHSSILKWPDKELIIKQAAAWATKTGQADANIISIKCFGSIMDERWGVGSDVDILVHVKYSNKNFISRSLDYNVSEIDIPVDILVYTQDELDSLEKDGHRFFSVIKEKSFDLYVNKF